MMRLYKFSGLLPLLMFTSLVTAGNSTQTIPNNMSPKAQTPLILSYTQSKTEYERQRERYFLNLLTLALDNAGELYELNPISIDEQVESRGARLLEKGIYTVHWLHTNPDLESNISPVRIPLFKGLIGWRLLLIREEDIDSFKGISTLKQLQAFQALQGNNWPDTKILRNNGFQLKTSRDYRSLFRMLEHGRGDFFPRGVLEAWAELSTYPELNLVIEEHLAFYYPTAYYFFFSNKNVRLKNAVEKGLEMALQDGTFDAIFMKHYGDVLKKSNLEKRTVLHLKNNRVPIKTPLERKELWYSIPNPSPQTTTSINNGINKS